MQPAISINNLRKQYRGSDLPAVNGLSLEVAPGTITGLLGPNGAGKTTTIAMLCGLFAPDSGHAQIFGLDCFPQREKVRSIIGVVPQQIALFGQLSALENLAYLGALFRLDKQLVKARSALLLERLGLTPHANKQVGRYSGGMKRRANIAAALLHEPRLLILDEPTAGVDVQSRALILDFLKSLRAEQTTILYTSHLLDEAEQLCDHIHIMDEGRHMLGGTPQTLVATTEGARRLEDVFLHHTGRSIRD